MAQARAVGVLGGSGGVGASALGAAIAVRAAAASRSAPLVDGRRRGGGLDVLLGAEQEQGLRWPDLARVRGELDGGELRRRLPVAEGVPVVAFDRSRDVALSAGPVREVLAASAEACEVLVLDLPDVDDPLFAPMAEPVDLLVLVCGRGVAELAAASAKTSALVTACSQVWLCVRTAGRGAEFADEVAAALDLPLLGVLRDDPGLVADLLHGIPPGHRRGPHAELADRLLAQLLLAVPELAS